MPTPLCNYVTPLVFHTKPENLFFFSLWPHPVYNCNSPYLYGHREMVLKLSGLVSYIEGVGIEKGMGTINKYSYVKVAH